MIAMPKRYYAAEHNDEVIIFSPSKGDHSDRFDEVVHNRPYKASRLKLYSTPTSIGRIWDEQAFSATPKYITDDAGVIIKKRGEHDFILPECFSSVSDLGEVAANWLHAQFSKDEYLNQEATLLFHHHDGYDSELPSELHFDPPEPVDGVVYNAFYVASLYGTEYATGPNQDAKDLKASTPFEIYRMDSDCLHRRGYLPEGESRNFALIMTRG